MTGRSTDAPAFFYLRIDELNAELQSRTATRDAGEAATISGHGCPGFFVLARKHKTIEKSAKYRFFPRKPIDNLQTVDYNRRVSKNCRHVNPSNCHFDRFKGGRNNA